MRTKTVFLVLLAAVLSAPSCIRIMESGEDGASIIFIECLQGVSDTTAISVIATAPKFGYGESRILSDMNVTLKAGGKEIPLSNAGVEAELFPKGAYYTTERIPGGQTLEIEVSGQGLAPVVATTVKPQEVRPFRMTLERTLLYDEEYSSADIGTKVIKMEISPDDPDMPDHYYVKLPSCTFSNTDDSIYSAQGAADSTAKTCAILHHIQHRHTYWQQGC